jgi:hypothetical protein
MELYKKIYIKSEVDLPKEEGNYFCNRNGFNSVQHLMTTLGKSYMREIRWYLQPIEQPPDKPSDEDIQKAAMEWQNDTSTSFNQGMYSGYIFGAIDMRDGRIPINKK